MTVGITYWPSIAKLAMKTRLQESLIDNVDESDESRAGIVCVGRHLGDPARAGIVVEIHENDFESEYWPHEVEREGPERSPTYVGGIIGRQRNMWMRRFTIRVIVFKKGVGQETADAIRGAVISRIEKMLLDDPTLGGIVDSGGERSIMGRIVREKGVPTGDDKTPQWRYVVFLEFKTERKQVL